MTEPSVSTARSALCAKCPRCAKGRLFTGPLSLTLAQSCEACGLDYKFAEIGDGPAVFAIFILGALVLAGAMIAEFKLGIPYLYHMPFWLVATPLLAIFCLKRLKATLMAMQYAQRAGDGSPRS